MKKTLFLFSLLLSFTGLSGQMKLSVGAQFTPSFSSTILLKAPASFGINKPETGFSYRLGGVVNLALGENLELTSGLNLDITRFREIYGTDSEFKGRYYSAGIGIPVRMQYFLGQGNVRWFIAGGLQFTLLVRGSSMVFTRTSTSANWVRGHTVTYGPEGFLQPVYLEGELGGGAEFQLSGGMALRGSPFFAWQLLNMYPGFEDFNSTFWRVGVNFNLLFDL